MRRTIFAVSILTMSCGAQAMTVLDARIAGVSARHAVVPVQDIVPITARDYRSVSDMSINAVAANAALVAPLLDNANTVYRSVSARPVSSEVPDVVTWMLMIVGFGYVGLAASRRRPAVAA